MPFDVKTIAKMVSPLLSNLCELLADFKHKLASLRSMPSTGSH